jgi:hypothetical protein
VETVKNHHHDQQRKVNLLRAKDSVKNPFNEIESFFLTPIPPTTQEYRESIQWN